jgi:hypothetical protein
MSNNSNTVLTMFCIVTLIVCLSSLETNALSAFVQTDNITMDNIQASDTSNHTLNGGLSSWVCFTEFDHTDCKDMSNTSSTYIGLAVGAAIGGVISWWIYNRQNKTSRRQDEILHHIEQIERQNGEIERKNAEILKHLESYAKHHELVLNKIVLLDESIEALDKKIESTRP